MRIHILFAALALTMVGVRSTSASAQAVERNLPPLQSASPGAIKVPAISRDEDARPIGPPLSRLIVVDTNDAIVDAAETSVQGVDVHRVPRLLPKAKRFQHFLGKPISRKLISDIEAEISAIYRSAGFPFVHLSTPAQEISHGVLQIHILEFHVGKTRVVGAGDAEAGYIDSRIRLKSGDNIDKGELAEDLDWLNRAPSRRIDVVASPSTEQGATDLTFNVTNLKPWSIDFGYANSGSPNTGTDRYFAGLQMPVPGLHDASISYQATGSDDALFRSDKLFNGAENPRYISNALRLDVPTLPRQDIVLTLDFITTNQPVEVFLSQDTIFESSLAYRSDLTNFSKMLSGEATVGLELKRDDNDITFGGISINRAHFDVYQMLLGYRWQAKGSNGQTVFEADLHISPGGLSDHNSNLSYANFSNGRFKDASYAYFAGNLSHLTLLGPAFGSLGLSLSNSLAWQYSSVSLPPTEQMGLGGPSLVRGYTLDDGAFDTAILSRSELRKAALNLPRSIGTASPYVFFDVGYGEELVTNHSETAASVGFGADFLIFNRLTLSADAALPLRDAGETIARRARIECRATTSF